MEKVQVVVMGRNYTSLLGMIRAAGEAGCDVTVVRTVQKMPKNWIKAIMTGEPIEKKSKYVKKHLYAVQTNREAFIELLLNEYKDGRQKVILLPTDDWVASTIDLYQDKLRDRFLFPNVNACQGMAVQLMDKDVQKKLAVEAGLNIAQGWVVNAKNGEYVLPSGIKYPCFTKPQISFLGDKRCMKKCCNEDELRSVIDYVVKKRNCPILVEQYIEIEKEYGILGVCVDGKCVVPGIVKKIIVGNGGHKGVTLLGKYSRIDEFGDLKNRITDFVIKTQFTGLFDIDLYEENGKIYFNELNLRFGAFGFSAMCAEINLPEILIKYFLGEELCIEKYKLNEEVTCISEKVNLEDYEAGYISWKEHQENKENAEYSFIKYAKDIAPYRAFRRKIIISKIKRCVRTVLKR